MFNFPVSIGDLVILVWEKDGALLMGISRQQFKDADAKDGVGCDEVCDTILGKLWNVIIVKSILKGRAKSVSIYRPNTFL